MSRDSSDITIEDIALGRLRQLVRPLDRPGSLIRFPLAFGRMCSVLCINKGQAWKVLRRLETQGSIEIVPYQGIRLAPSTAEGCKNVGPANGRPRTVAQRRILGHLKNHGRAYPSEIARALNMDIDTVLGAARRLLREGLIDT